jgi:UDP-N-acetylglucosamine transferase subunit ALG13
MASDPTPRSHRDNPASPSGIVIFVTVGTTHFPFDRLLSAVAALDTDQELVVQRGPSRVSLGNAWVTDFLAFDKLNDHVRRADIVITHAGVGSIMVALSHGKRPVVVPRLERFGEAVDDHQVQVATQLDRTGRVRAVLDLADLGRVVTTATNADAQGGLLLGPLVEVVADEVRRAASQRP